MKKLLLIDANSIIHRAFHAIPEFTTPDGRPSGAIYGIASILLKLWREDRPDYAAALFDRPEPTFREEKYLDYKAQRPPAPDELIAQIMEAHTLFAAFGIKTFEAPGYEADDLIATFAEKFRRNGEGVTVVILTGDRDTFQLVEDGRVLVQTFNKGVSDTTVYDERAVKEKFGVTPAQMVDYKALVGDASDNIKGVPGIGPKTAVELLSRFGSLDGIFAGMEGDEKVSKKIAPHRAAAELSRELVILERNVPLPVPPLGELEPRKEVRDKAIEDYFIDMGFATLLKRIYEGEGANGSVKGGKQGGEKKTKEENDGAGRAQASLF
jgi:DNA polymerase-1